MFCLIHCLCSGNYDIKRMADFSHLSGGSIIYIWTDLCFLNSDKYNYSGFLVVQGTSCF